MVGNANCASHAVARRVWWFQGLRVLPPVLDPENQTVVYSHIEAVAVLFDLDPRLNVERSPDMLIP